MLWPKRLKSALRAIAPEPAAAAAGIHFTPFNSLAGVSKCTENSPLPPPGLPPPPAGQPPQIGPPPPSSSSPSLVPGESMSSSSSSLVKRLQVASQSALSRNLNKGVQLEIKVHSCLRSTSKRGRILVVAGLAVVLVGFFLVPLALGGGSFYEANRICCERYLAFWEEAGYRDYHGDDPAPWDVECEAGSVTWAIPESGSHILIFPGFFFNTVSAIVSFAGAVYWLFFSPHRFNTAEIDAELDRKLMSFLLTQCVSQFCVLVLALWSCCPNAIATFIVLGMYNGASFGGSIMATNILCHRHLFAQAKYMARSAPDEDTNEKLILLEKACKWQLLSILMIAPPCTILQGMAAFSPIVHLINYFVLGAFTLILFVVDGTITIILTFLYLRPITKVEGSIVPPGVREKLQRARRLTVAGVSLMVFSTSALYLNIFVTFVQLIFVKTGDSFLADPYLNPLSFGMNLDCLLNIVGMVVVCEGTRKPTENKNVQPGRSDVRDGKKRRPDSSRNVY